MFRKIISIFVLSCMMVTSTVTLSFANQINNGNLQNENVSIYQISENQLLVNENGIKSTVTFNETATGSTVSVNNLNTGKSEHFIRDEVKGTLYSSITGKTINLENISESSLRSSSTSKISYYTLSDMISVGATAAEVVGAIVGYFGYVAASNILALVSAVLTTIDVGLKNQTTSRGLKVTVSSVRMTKWQGGKEIVYYVDKIINVSTY